MGNQEYEKLHNMISSNYNKQIVALNENKILLADAHNRGDIREMKKYIKIINNLLGSISYYESVLNTMRLNDDLDLEERELILRNFPSQVDEVIPDEVPLVFHGNKNIFVVKKIITSGKLLPPSDFNQKFKRFETQVEVTGKKNIKVSCECADAGKNSFLPYGAIFVFYPHVHEYDNVLSTGTNTEVFGGVEALDLKKDDRLFSIITTNENIRCLKELAKENNLDEQKIVTHNEFLELCQKKFREKQYTKKSEN